MYRCIIKLVVILLITMTLLQAQFIDVQVEIKSEQLPQKERMDLQKLAQDLPYYFENFDWIDNVYGMQVPLKINVYPQSVNDNGFERIFTAQFFISTHIGDQRFFEKGMKFVYNTNDPLSHTEMFHPLTSLLDYYAYLLLAGEADTYEPLGGNTLYSKARDIASRAELSERPTGWAQRSRDLDEMLMLRDYRMMKYYYFSIYDAHINGETGNIRETIDKTLKHIEDMFEFNDRERFTHIFLDVYARDFMFYLKQYGTVMQQNKLQDLDPDNREVYKKILSE